MDNKNLCEGCKFGQIIKYQNKGSASFCHAGISGPSYPLHSDGKNVENEDKSWSYIPSLYPVVECNFYTAK